jgi:hypothetical protein
MITRLESPLGVEIGLSDESPRAHPPKGLCIGKTMVRDLREVPVKVLNAIRRD